MASRGAGGRIPDRTAIQETPWLGDLPVATLRGATTIYVAPDHLGAPHQITNAAQQVLWLWDHDPFGNGAPSAVGGFTYNLRFPGQYADAETGLNYNYYRDYNPRFGRYMQSDPIGLAGGINTYAYADHDVVVSNGRVYDAFTGPGGASISDYNALWQYPNAIKFGF